MNRDVNSHQLCTREYRCDIQLALCFIRLFGIGNKQKKQQQMMSSPYLDQYEGELHVAASYNHQQGQTNNAQRQESASRREHSSAARTATSTFNAATSQSQDHILQWFNATLAAPSSSVADLPQADAFSSLNTPTTEKQAFSSSQSSQLRQMQPFQQQQQQQQQLHPSPQLPIPVPMWPLFDYPVRISWFAVLFC